jgi:hypothetical protein
MKLSFPISIYPLKKIQEDILKHFPWDKLNKGPSLFYIPNNLDIFLNIKELNDVLNNLELISYVRSFAFNVTQPNTVSNIHIDTGESCYSFNLPLLNCDNTYTAFYETTKEPILKEYKAINQIITYRWYDPIFCTEIHKIEMNIPHIINIYTPHNIINTNNTHRITFLIRFIKDFDQYWESIK